MPSGLLGGAQRCLALALAVGGLSVACTIEPPAGTPPPPMSACSSAAGENAFGRTGDEVVNNPQLRDKIRSMFGTDWAPGGKLVRGAMPYLERTEAPRGVRSATGTTSRSPAACRPPAGRTAWCS